MILVRVISYTVQNITAYIEVKIYCTVHMIFVPFVNLQNKVLKKISCAILTLYICSVLFKLKHPNMFQMKGSGEGD